MKHTSKLTKLIPTALLTASLAVSAVSAEPLLSPGINVLAADFEMVRTGVAGADIRFSSEHFAEALGISEVKKITVTSLPDPKLGRLRLGSLDVADGQTISAKNLASLRFIPTNKDELEATFEFTLGDDPDGADYTCRVFALSHINQAPVMYQPEVIESGVYSGLDRLGSVKCEDPDGDSFRVELVGEPSHGSVRITSPELGYYVYTPDADFTGRDSFTLRAVDRYGSHSNSVRVSVTVDAVADGELSETLADHWSASALLTCMRAGLISEDVDPDAPMSRAQFLDFMMEAAGYGKFNVTDTGFADDDIIPTKYKGSIAAAEALGVISGIETENGLCFFPNNQITRAEAAVIVARLTGAIYTLSIDESLYEVIEVSADTESTSTLDPSIPAWARSSMKALQADGLLRGEFVGDTVSLSPYEVITNAAAAQLAASIMTR